MRGRSFNMVMNNALRELYGKKVLKYLDDVFVRLKNGKKVLLMDLLTVKPL